MIDRRLLTLARTQMGALLPAAGLSLVGGLLLVAQAWLLSHAVAGAFLGGLGLRALAGVLILLAAVVAARVGCAWGSDRAARHLASRVKSTLRARLGAHLLALGPAFTRTAASGELAATAVRGVEDLDDYFSQFLPQVATGVLLPLAILAVVLPIDPLSGVVLLVTLPVLPIFMALIGMATRAVTNAQFAAMSRLSAHFLDVVQGLTTLKLFGRSRRQTEVVAAMGDELRRATMRVLRVAFLNALALEVIATLSTAIIAVEIGFRLLYRQITFEHAFFVLLLAPEFYTPIRLISQRFHAAMPGVAAAERIFAVLATPTQARVDAAPQLTWMPSMQSVTFSDVTFTYPGAESPALDHLSLTMRTGERVALVGASGAGKSTLTQLLLGFIAPTEGTIDVDGVALGDLPLDAWRGHIAWAPPRPHLFARSVAENIRLGRPSATDAEVRAAAQLAQADAFIQSLPLGEGGAALSGGQAQRIALARALLRDAPLLIFDEALAQIDPWQTRAILADVDAMRRNRMTLVIAHRLAAARSADRIVVLEGGHIVGDGTHTSLLTQCPPYAALVAAEEHEEAALCVA
jgi:ATP-binding cassette subfamily C protein CydD